MENMDHEASDFRKRSVLAVCAAGTDRSRYISEELNNRGYFASAAGVLKNHNYVTEGDLANVGIIVFSSPHEKKIFDKDKRLKKIVAQNRIEERVMCITESDKDRAHNANKVEKLKSDIREQLDCVGLSNLR